MTTGKYSVAQVCNITIGPTPADELQTVDAASFGLPQTQSFVNDSVLTPHELIDRDSLVSKNMPLQPVASRNLPLSKAQSQAQMAPDPNNSLMRQQTSSLKRSAGGGSPPAQKKKGVSFTPGDVEDVHVYDPNHEIKKLLNKIKETQQRETILAERESQKKEEKQKASGITFGEKKVDYSTMPLYQLPTWHLNKAKVEDRQRRKRIFFEMIRAVKAEGQPAAEEAFDEDF